MTELNLIKLLRIFSKKDLSEFDKFLRSPFHNNQNTLVRLFREIKKYYPDFTSKKLNHTLLFISVNPGKEFNPLVFRKYISNLTKLAEKYLTVVKISEDKYRIALSLLEVYDIAGLDNLYKKKEREISGSIVVKYRIDGSYFLNRIWHSEIRYNNQSKKFSGKSLNAITENHLYIYLYFIHSYSNNLRKFYVHKYNFNISEGNEYLKKCFSLLDEKHFTAAEKLFSGEALLVFRLFKYDINISRDDTDENSFNKLRDTLFQCKDILSYNLLYYFLARLNIFCHVMSTRGKTGFKGILFENYKFMFDSGLFFSDGRRLLSRSEYMGVLLSSLKVKEFDWVENFILKCKRNHYIEDYENLSLYGYSFLSFYKGEFEKCINYCMKVNLNDFALRVGISKIAVKAMYELGYLDSAKPFLTNYKHYLFRNKKISNVISSREIKFIEYYNQLLKNTKPAGKTYLKNIIKKLDSETSIADKQWLLDKYALLRKV